MAIKSVKEMAFITEVKVLFGGKKGLFNFILFFKQIPSERFGQGTGREKHL